MSDKLIAGEPYSVFAERLDHAARMCWRQAREEPSERDRYIRTSRNLAAMAETLRNEDQDNDESLANQGGS